MKNLTLIILLCAIFANAQIKKEPADTAKIVFTEIVKVDSTNRFELFKKASTWIEGQKFEILEMDPIEGKLLAKDQIIVYTDKSVLAKPNGDFFYDIAIEIKEGKYRYTFSNFVYRYYKQDRYGKFVPVVKGSKPMEDTKAAGWKKQWGRNKLQVNNEVNGHINNLKNAMKYVAPKPVIAPKPKEEW